MVELLSPSRSSFYFNVIIISKLNQYTKIRIFDPVSHLETVLADTPNFSASCSCVRLFSLRHCFKKSSYLFVSMFLPLFHLQLTNYFRNPHDINRESPDFRPDIACPYRLIHFKQKIFVIFNVIPDTFSPFLNDNMTLCFPVFLFVSGYRLDTFHSIHHLLSVFSSKAFYLPISDGLPMQQ